MGRQTRFLKSQGSPDSIFKVFLRSQDSPDSAFEVSGVARLDFEPSYLILPLFDTGGEGVLVDIGGLTRGLTTARLII